MTYYWPGTEKSKSALISNTTALDKYKQVNHALTENKAFVRYKSKNEMKNEILNNKYPLQTT